MSWIVAPIALSVVLTVLLNVGLRVFSGPANRRAASTVTDPGWPAAETRSTNRRVRVWMPWKGMIVGSVVLTILVNLALWIA